MNLLLAVLVTVVATAAAAAAVRSWWVGRWVARARAALAATPCPRCGVPLGAAAGRGRAFGLFDVAVTCDRCGTPATYTLTPAGPVLGLTLSADEGTGRPK